MISDGRERDEKPPSSQSPPKLKSQCVDDSYYPEADLIKSCKNQSIVALVSELSYWATRVKT